MRADLASARRRHERVRRDRRRPRRHPRVCVALSTLDGIRRICLSFPETTERQSHGSPSFFVRDKKMFATVTDNHHGDGRFAILCAALEGAQTLLVEADAERFFVPPYVGHRGWLGVRLDRGLDWDELTGILEDAYACVAPRSLVERAAAETDATWSDRSTPKGDRPRQGPR